MFPFAGPGGAPTTLIAEPEVRHLYTGTQIGALTLPNRVVMAAMSTGFATPDGLPTPRLLAWYGARATGGVGLVIIESTLVEPADAGTPPPHPRLRLASDEAVPGFATLVDIIHRAGARAAVELNHRPVPDPAALPQPTIDAAIMAFGAAAGRARAAGFDAVQIQCSHRSLLAQLLSPATNRRRDKYGRGATGRLRALLDTVAAVRRATGDRLAIIVKYSADEFRPRGLNPESAAEIGRQLAEAGVDALEVVAGSEATDHDVKLSCGVGEATHAELAAAIRDAAGIPVLAAGRIMSSESAERVLREGQADLLSLGRALLADPAWLAKVRAGVELELIPCIGCMACFTPGPDGATGCPVAGEAGHEYLPPLEHTATPRSLAVLGASMAGLELARVAASRGHRVEIATAGLPLGGLFGLRSGVPGNAEFGRAFLYFGDRLTELGVGIADEPSRDAEVTFDCRPEPEVRPAWASGRSLLLASELLGRDLHELYGIGRRVAVVGPGALAAEVALFLGGWGRRPSVVVPGPAAHPFPDVHPMHAARLRERLDGYKVPLVTGAAPLEWRYDPERKSQLRVLRGGREQLLGPFHSAVCVAGWPDPPGLRAAVSPTERRQAQRETAAPPEVSPVLADPEQTAGSLRWPAAVVPPELPKAILSGAVVSLGDTPYAEPLRDLVAYAHQLGRIV